ncbi:hypothetical protein CLOM_g12533 [Closterium sp. NIES-68]|nr:hypothetical protein CLOM_g12533 [Closterium sp. NIES-68]
MVIDDSDAAPDHPLPSPQDAGAAPRPSGPPPIPPPLSTSPPPLTPVRPQVAGGDVQLWSYADDTYLVGPPDRVLHHFTGVVRRLGGLGLAVQPHKCLVHHTSVILPRDVQAFTDLGIEVARRGLTVTGVPARVAALSCPLDPSLLTVTPLLSSTSLTSPFLFPYSYLS